CRFAAGKLAKCRRRFDAASSVPGRGRERIGVQARARKADFRQRRLIEGGVAMVTVAYRRPAAAKTPRVSFVLLDWSCRESFHSLDYLSDQTVDRDDYEIIWIEFYQRRAADLDKKLADYSARGRSAPLDLWTIIGMDRSLYYHKHLMYNIGIVQSRGDIVVICNSDAMFPPNFVEAVITAFRESPESVVHFDEVRNA